MRLSLLWRQRSPLDDRPSRPLRAAVRADARKRVSSVARARSEQGINALHKAQYISAFLEALSAELSHRNAIDARFAALPASAEHHSTSLRSLAAELEAMYGALQPRQVPGPSPSVPVAFGAWRGDDDAIRRESKRSDFLPHCVLREARTPPGWSHECLGRALPLDGAPLRRLTRLLQGVCTMANGDEQAALLDDLIACQEVAATAELRLSGEDRRALTSFAIQHLVATSGSWELAAAYLRRHLGSTTGPLREYAEDAAQQIAVFAEAVRYLDLPAAGLPPVPALRGLVDAALAGMKRRGQARGRLAPVVAAPLLSIVYTPESPAVVREFSAAYLFHSKRGSAAAAGAHRPVYMPAAAWGEYLRALHRCGGTLQEVQQVTDDVTDPARTQHAAELLSSPHVWTAYFACVDGPHALSIFEDNRAHYRLRETPATVAALIGSLARGGAGGDAESVDKGLALYKRLRATAGGKQVVGTASVLASLAALHEAAGDQSALLRMCVDLPDVLVYFGVTELWWAAETDGRRLLAGVGPDGRAAPPAAAAYVAYLRLVSATFSVPPVVEHAITGAIDRMLKRPVQGPDFELSADALADMM